MSRILRDVTLAELADVAIEMERFQRRVQEYVAAPVWGNKHRAAMLRASMDLTRQLAVLRGRGRYE